MPLSVRVGRSRNRFVIINEEGAKDDEQGQEPESQKVNRSDKHKTGTSITRIHKRQKLSKPESSITTTPPAASWSNFFYVFIFYASDANPSKARNLKYIGCTFVQCTNNKAGNDTTVSIRFFKYQYFIAVDTGPYI